jgi:hypothetical protein
MLSFAMIFTREITAARSRAGNSSMSRSSPSIRKRTFSPFSDGSRWMSEARASVARLTI